MESNQLQTASQPPTGGDGSRDECQCKPHEHRKEIHFSVDGEPLIAWSNDDEAKLSVSAILQMAGNEPPSDYYLVEFAGEGHAKREKFENIEQVVPVKSHSRFAAVFRGCTPVS